MKSLKLILSDKAYFAPAWVFASLNIMTGTWVLYLPYVKTKFELDDAQVGIALFSLALGLLVSIPFVPILNKRLGVGRSTQLGIIFYALAFNLPLLSFNYYILCACLSLVGFFSGFTDISMNALVSTIEKRDNTHVMSASHGFFSLGGFIGAGIGSVLMTLILNPVWHMFLISMLIVVINIILSRYYLYVREEAPVETDKEDKLAKLKLLFGLAVVAFIIMMNEGSVEHWSNLYLFDIIQTSESKAGLGFIAFSLCMTIGRFYGDEISKKMGSINIILGGCLIGAFGYILILSTQLILSVSGFGVLGLGLSVIIPELFRLAGKTKGVPSSVGIAIVSGIGFAGFLSGPVILGFISDWSNLSYSFVFLLCTVILALSLTFFSVKRMYK